MTFYDSFNKYIEKLDEMVMFSETCREQGMKSDWIDGKITTMKSVLMELRSLIQLYTSELPEKYKKETNVKCIRYKKKEEENERD